MQLILCCTFLCRDHVYTNHRQSFLLSIFVLTFILYWSIVDLQYCVSFRCIAKMLQLYICLFFLKFFSHLGYYGLLSRVPCAIQQVLVGYPFKYACILSRFSCDWLFVTPWTAASRSSVHGILQARILEWVAMPSSRGFSWPRDQTCVSYVSCFGRQPLPLPLAPSGKPILNTVVCICLETMATFTFCFYWQYMP